MRVYKSLYPLLLLGGAISLPGYGIDIDDVMKVLNPVFEP